MAQSHFQTNHSGIADKGKLTSGSVPGKPVHSTGQFVIKGEPSENFTGLTEIKTGKAHRFVIGGKPFEFFCLHFVDCHIAVKLLNCKFFFFFHDPNLSINFIQSPL